MTFQYYGFSRCIVLSVLIAFLQFTETVYSRRTTPQWLPTQQHAVIGPADVTACDANYGRPFYGDCEGAILDMRNNVRPPDYLDWTSVQADAFNTDPREFKRDGDDRSRNWPNGDLVGVPLGWQKRSCLISITLKAANSASDLSNWLDIYNNFRLLNQNCVGDRSAGSGGSMLTGENNRVRIEIYGPDTKLKKYQKLKTLCKQGAEYQDLPQCNSEESVTEGVSADLLAQLQQANVGAPLAQGQCAGNAYSLSNGGACNGFVYDLITLSKDMLGVLFGVPSSVAWAETGAFILSTASGWIDGGSS
ncbi:MAG: hypothetical protein M1812_005644 [Candelaria pacifica]|nr:MAG: hypothetical protein M1812_005644 [Candelaria pacifica]